MRFRWLAIVLALFGTGIGIVSVAWGDDTATARLRFQEGVDLYDKGQYDKARAAFLQAYALKKHPAILLNLGQSNLKLGRAGEAARNFVQLLKEPQGLTPAQKTEAEVGLTAARAKCGRIDVQAVSGAEIVIDGERMGVAPTEAIDVEPGSHTVKVKDQPEKSVNVAVGQIVTVKMGGNVSVAPPPTTTDAGAPSGDAGAAPVYTAPDESFLGGNGESCRSRADCKSNLKCIRKTCVDENAPPPAQDDGLKPVDSDSNSKPNEWLGFQLEGVHPFVGIELSGGPAWALVGIGGRTLNDRNVQGAVVFALRGGVFVGKSELALELSPFTYLPYATSFGAIRGAAFQVMGTYRYFIPIRESDTVSVYWPLGAGIGMFAGGDNTVSLAYFQARADLVGVALRIGHLMIDFNLPSFRYGVSDSRGGTPHIVAWLIGGNVSYVF